MCWFDKTRGTGEYASYRSDPSTLQNATPSSAGDYSSTLRQPSQFQQPVTPTKSWAPVTPSVTSPLPQTSPTNFNQVRSKFGTVNKQQQNLKFFTRWFFWLKILFQIVFTVQYQIDNPKSCFEYFDEVWLLRMKRHLV